MLPCTHLRASLKFVARGGIAGAQGMCLLDFASCCQIILQCCTNFSPQQHLWEFVLFCILANPWYCQIFEVFLIWSCAFPWFLVCVSIISYVYLAVSVTSFVTGMAFYWVAFPSPYIFNYLCILFILVGILHFKYDLPVAYLSTSFLVCFVVFKFYILVKSYLLVCSFMLGAL